MGGGAGLQENLPEPRMVLSPCKRNNRRFFGLSQNVFHSVGAEEPAHETGVSVMCAVPCERGRGNPIVLHSAQSP